MALVNNMYAVNEVQAQTYLAANNFNKAQICGILANIYEESRFKLDARSERDGAYGLCQWKSERLITLYKKYGACPSLKSQLNYIQDEFNSTKTKARSYFENIPDTREGAGIAGYNFAKYYEQCHLSQYDQRQARAIEYWDYYSNYTPPISPSNSLKFTDSESGITGEGTPSTSPAKLSLTTIDAYRTDIVNNLSRVTAKGFDYGYLINLSYGGEFRFYVPEFSESAGAVWGKVDIPGRSVDIKYYTSTNSRSITVSLELYAGVGLYAVSDPVGALHADINFVKSLEYPDNAFGLLTPPATVQLILGSTINLTGVVSDVSVEHLKPLDNQNRSMYVKLSFTVTQIAANPPGQSDIRNGSTSMRSTENPSSMISTQNN